MAVNLGKWLPTISHHNNLEKGKGDKNYYDNGKNDATMTKMICSNDIDDSDGDDSDDADKEIMDLGRP